MKQREKRKNFLIISLIRFFCPTAVFIYHVLVGYTNLDDAFRFLYFAVHVFLFISGFLYGGVKELNIKPFFLKTTKRILLPVIVAVGLFAVLISLFNLISHTIYIPISVNYSSGTTLYIFSHLWYVYAILVCYLCTPFIHSLFFDGKINKKLCSVIIISVCLINIALTTKGLRLVVLSYFAGYFFRNYRIDVARCLRLIFSIVVLAIGTTIYYLSFYINIKPIFYCTREISGFIATTGFLIFFITLAEFFKEREIPKILKISDKHSYSFYIVHHVFLIGGFSVLYSSLGIYATAIIAYVLSIIFMFIVDFLTELVSKLYLRIKTKYQRKEKADAS